MARLHLTLGIGSPASCCVTTSQLTAYASSSIPTEFSTQNNLLHKHLFVTMQSELQICVPICTSRSFSPDEVSLNASQIYKCFCYLLWKERQAVRANQVPIMARTTEVTPNDKAKISLEETATCQCHVFGLLRGTDAYLSRANCAVRKKEGGQLSV